MAYFRKRENGWEYRISYKTPDGKYKQKSKSGFKTKALANQAAIEAERKIQKNIIIDENQTLAEYYDNWAKIHKKPNVTAITWKKYKYTGDKIKKYFKDIKLHQVTNSMYQEVLNEFSSTHSQETVEKFHCHLKAAIKMAVYEGILDRNFCDFARIRSNVGKTPTEAKFLEEEEYLNLIHQTSLHINYHSYFILYLIAVTGMRFAEAVGLTWSDIDFDNKLIDVNKTYSYNATFDFAPTKNKSSIRKIPIDDLTAQFLKTYQKKYAVPDKQGRIFNAVSNTAANKTIKKIVGRNVHVHSLRHTYASYLISQGVDLISISQLLGHENLNITLKVYAHQLDKLKDKNHNLIRNIFEKFGADLGQT